jgi:hypothetical protein
MRESQNERERGELKWGGMGGMGGGVCVLIPSRRGRGRDGGYGLFGYGFGVDGGVWMGGRSGVLDGFMDG